MNRYTIEPARDGGYFVIEEGRPNQYNPIAFAGTLVECLDYIKAKLEAKPN